MKKVKIYTTAECPQCEEVKNYLNAQSVAFEEIDLMKNEKAGIALIKQTGYSMVPQIQIDGRFIVGFDRRKIDELLEN